MIIAITFIALAYALTGAKILKELITSRKPATSTEPTVNPLAGRSCGTSAAVSIYNL